eukprot:918786_1
MTTHSTTENSCGSSNTQDHPTHMITPPSKLQAIAATPTQNTRSNTNIEHVIQPNDNRNRKPSRLHPPKTKIKCVSEMCWCPRCEAESIFVVRQAGCNRGSSNNPSSKSQAIAVTPTQNTRSNTNIGDNAEEKEMFAPMNVPGTKQRLIQYIRTRTNTNFRYEILRNQLDFDQAFSMFEDMPFHQRCLSFFGRKYLLMLASVDYIDLDHRQAVNILWVFSVLEIYIEISIAFLHLWPELKIKTQEILSISDTIINKEYTSEELNHFKQLTLWILAKFGPFINGNLDWCKNRNHLIWMNDDIINQVPLEIESVLPMNHHEEVKYDDGRLL